MKEREAQELVGKTGRIRNPSKGFWEGDYRVTGYDPELDDDNKVKHLRVESIATFPPAPGPDGTTVPERPQVIANRLDPRWFKPHA